MNNEDVRPLLYNESSTAGVGYDLANLLSFINGFTLGLTSGKLYIDTAKCEVILIGMTKDFPYKDGIAGASIFKKAANFVAYFVAERPLTAPFEDSLIGPELTKIENHQNGMVALSVAIAALHGAEIHRNDGTKTLVNKIQLSKHSYVDIVDALCAGMTPQSHFKILAVLFEQMAYKSNPDCQYSDMADC